MGLCSLLPLCWVHIVTGLGVLQIWSVVAFLTSFLTNYLFYFFAHFCQIYAAFHWYFIMTQKNILLQPTTQDSWETITIVKEKRTNKHEELVTLSCGNKASGRKYRNNAKSWKKSHFILRKFHPFCTKNILLKIISIPASSPVLCNKKYS